MIQRISDYLISVVAVAIIGLGLGAILEDPWGGAMIGATVGVFVGVGVRASRTRDVRESYEDRTLSD